MAWTPQLRSTLVLLVALALGGAPPPTAAQGPVDPAPPLTLAASALTTGAAASAPTTGAAASAPTTGAAASTPTTAPLRIVVNLPARRLRLYRGTTRLMDVPAGIGKLHHEERTADTRTSVGSFTIESWHRDYHNERYPLPWSRDPEQGVFGPWTGKLAGDRHYHHLHGITGPLELGDAPLEVAPSPGIGRARGRWEWGLSHGCVRLANRDITRLKELCPVGTRVERIYCLQERVRTPDGGEEVQPLPDVYGYRGVATGAVFEPETGALTGYSHPTDARR